MNQVQDRLGGFRLSQEPSEVVLLQMAEDVCDGTCTDVCEHVPFEELDAIARSYKKLAGFDKDTVKKQR